MLLCVPVFLFKETFYGNTSRPVSRGADSVCDCSLHCDFDHDACGSYCGLLLTFNYDFDCCLASMFDCGSDSRTELRHIPLRYEPVRYAPSGLSNLVGKQFLVALSV